MLLFLTRRVLQALFVLLAITLAVAFAIRLSGDPALMLSQGAGSPSAEDLRHIRAGLGLDAPFLVQYGRFLKGLFSLDLGRSFFGGTSIAALVGQALPATLSLAAASLLLSIAVSVPLGVQAAVSRGRWSDQLIRVASLIGLSFPNFWLATMLVLLLAVNLPWLPPSGMQGPASFVLPTLTLAIILSASNVRLVRSAMLEVLGAQYITVVRAKGVGEFRLLYGHALPNCAISLLTFLGLQFGGLLGGIVVVEKVFSWPGMGSLAFDAVANRDYPVLQASVAVLAMLIIAVNLLVDIAYGLLDPRIRTE